MKSHVLLIMNKNKCIYPVNRNCPLILPHKLYCDHLKRLGVQTTLLLGCVLKQDTLIPHSTDYCPETKKKKKNFLNLKFKFISHFLKLNSILLT